MQHKRSRALASSSSPFLLAVLALAVSGAASAHDEGLPAFRYTAELLERLQLPSVALPLNDDLFLYGRDAEAFDLQAYLALNAPALRDRSEYLEHWSGYYSINPKVLLTLMVMQSGPLGAPDPQALAAPLGRLSAKQGFEAQVRDVLQQLSRRYYGFEEYRLRQAAAAGTVAENGLNPASAALLGLLLQDTAKADANGGHPLGAYAETFQRLFGTPSQALLQPRNRAARQLQAKAALVPPANLMQLPWRQGYSWQPNGAHSNSGSGYPLSSIDASYDWPRWGSPTYSVVAAHAGTVRVLSRCQVRVTHPSGWATNYYHMDRIQVSNGQQVSADTKLGIYASDINTALCEGGSSTGPHLHFSLLYNGAFVSLQGVNLGPYRINVGSGNYDNDCRRFYLYNQSAGTTHCAFRPLYNPGLAF
ncbi:MULTISPECIES: M23 family metallopeptidase [Pseudomonas aeruginosa group]|uniref:Protease LasA n=1 Tax=Pseudomonas paraeruginosa TaxID=2994495 RepID=A0A2R3IQ50_9PSED|nr:MULTISPECIES: M23 family metallopeptidase [Pseudomonas aeruginosa group]AVK04040.1 protease LasA [Pseudomonas paraeruginosa]AVR68299.1 M23 family peptidase [Pseudomonas paraeruginosa]AWE90588.1 protease LasA [Pseudomonas paraeruginosa]KSD79890.1 peptidase M23 [Pseudomonas aeruginosa]MBG3902714.1 M23 family metallopeptidase [Pseudomonas aeruginosa]